jgi:hypothetical protein
LLTYKFLLPWYYDKIRLEVFEFVNIDGKIEWGLGYSPIVRYGTAPPLKVPRESRTPPSIGEIDR